MVEPCENIESLFVQFLKGKLDGEPQKQIEKHLEACRRCQAELSFDRTLAANLSSRNDMPALSPHFNQSVIAQAAAFNQPFWNNALAFAFERPWIVSTFGILFSLLLGLGYAAWKIFGDGIDFFLALFPFMPWLIGLVLLLTFAIVYVNEKFIDKLVYSSKQIGVK